MTRLKNFALFVRAYLAALLPRRRAVGEPARILVAPAGKLGDVVCTTPVLRALRRALPRAKLYVRENGANEALLADSGLVDGYIRAASPRGYARELRQEGIDTVVITGPSLEDLAAALLARAPRIVAPRVTGGYCPHQTRPYLTLLRFVSTYPYAFLGYAPRERLRALEPLGIRTDDTKKHLGFSAGAHSRRAAFLNAHGLAEGGYAILSPGAGNKVKEWPAERFARVGEHLARRLPVVVIGSARDRREMRAFFTALCDRSRIIDAAEQFSLDELKAVIAGAALFVSVDTGPIYIAEAFDVPTVDIVGPVDERVQPPVGPRHLVVVPPGRTKAELFIMNARSYNAAEALRQVNAITAEAVIAALDRLIAELPHHS